jgi:hypothetical protein
MLRVVAVAAIQGLEACIADNAVVARLRIIGGETSNNQIVFGSSMPACQ